MQMNGSPSVVPEGDEHTSSDHVKDLFSKPDDNSLWDPTGRTGAGLAKLLAELVKAILSGQKFTGLGGCGSASL